MIKLLSLTIGLLLWAPATHAQSAVSQHYVPQILQRADSGLAKASNGQPASNFVFMFFSWLDDVQAAIAGSIDTENRIVLHEQNLSNMTPCLYNDLLLIEAKINQVNDALTVALAQKRVDDIWVLKELSSWLNGRYNNLVLGASNPNHVDEAFNSWYIFDNQTWCCVEPVEDSVCTQTSRAECHQQSGILFGNPESCGQVCQRSNPDADPQPTCPFDTNYLPPTSEGYGCDETALNAISPIAGSIVLERDAFLAFERRKQAFLNEHSNMIPTGDSILEFAGRTPINLPLQSEESRDHKRISGCAEDVRQIDQPTGRLPEGAARIALRSPFSFGYEEGRLSRLLEEVLRQLGRTREQENVLKVPSDYPAGSPQRAQALVREEKMTLFQKFTRTMLRAFYGEVNESSAGSEAVALLQSIDTQHRVEDEFAILRRPMLQLSQYASLPGSGVRRFVGQYAAFLRKACVFRPCNELLMQVLTIVEDDECFPYTNGSFLENGWDPTTCAAAD